MEAIILQKEDYLSIIKKIDDLHQVIDQNQKDKVHFIDNQEFINLMNISKRTAQTWRDEGKISFSQIGSKIYYKMEDVLKLLDKNYIPAFKK